MKLEDEIKQKSFSSLYFKGFVNLMFTGSWAEQKSKSFFNRYGLTPQQYNVLRILRGQVPQKVNVTLVKERMLDKNSDASRILDRLRMKSLIDKSVSFNDKRVVEVIINEKGLDLLERIDKSIKELELTLSKLNLQEVETLNTLLDKLRDYRKA